MEVYFGYVRFILKTRHFYISLGLRITADPLSLLDKLIPLGGGTSLNCTSSNNIGPNRIYDFVKMSGQTDLKSIKNGASW